jgi:hypothetical protein
LAEVVDTADLMELDKLEAAGRSEEDSTEQKPGSPGPSRPIKSVAIIPAERKSIPPSLRIDAKATAR